MSNRKGIFPPSAFQLLLVYWYVSDIINPQIISFVLNIWWLVKVPIFSGLSDAPMASKQSALVDNASIKTL